MAMNYEQEERNYEREGIFRHLNILMTTTILNWLDSSTVDVSSDDENGVIEWRKMRLSIEWLRVPDTHRYKVLNATELIAAHLGLATDTLFDDMRQTTFISLYGEIVSSSGG